MELGNKICELRKKANISQEQLSEKLNVTRQTISNWELGQTAPDIFQAKEIAKIFAISLDELTDNEIKDILVERISNTEKMTSTAIKILKFLCVVIICFLIIIVSLNITMIIKNKSEALEKQNQEQLEQEYKASVRTKKFDITINDNEKYEYTVLFYGKDNKPAGSSLSLISEYTPVAYENCKKHCDYVYERFYNYIDVRELINDIKLYFEHNGGIWEEDLIEK